MASFQEKSRTVGREAKLGLKALGYETFWLQALEYTTFWLKVPGCTTFGLNCMSLGLCHNVYPDMTRICLWRLILSVLVAWAQIWQEWASGCSF